MAVQVNRRTFLKYSGDAKYLQLLIAELQRQLETNWRFNRQEGKATVSAEVELTIPGLSIECQVQC